MKKIYNAPEMEVVKIQMTGMLATSAMTLDAGTEITTDTEILAPELSEGIGDNLGIPDFEW